MTEQSPNHEYRAEMRLFLIGFAGAIAFTIASFALVLFPVMGGRATFYTILGMGLAQMVVHFRCFLHISLARSARADLLLVLFASMIVALMVGGTLVILFNLRMRMM